MRNKDQIGFFRIPLEESCETLLAFSKNLNSMWASALHKKWFGHIYWRNPQRKTSFLCSGSDNLLQLSGQYFLRIWSANRRISGFPMDIFFFLTVPKYLCLTSHFQSTVNGCKAGNIPWWHFFLNLVKFEFSSFSFEDI